MNKVHPLLLCMLSGILHAACVGAPILTVLSPLFLYFSGIQAGIFGLAITSIPYVLTHIASGFPLIKLLPYLLFILTPALLWTIAYKLRLFYIQSDTPKWGLPSMVAFFSFGLCLIYTLAFSNPIIYSYFQSAYEASLPLFKKASEFYGFESNLMIEQLPEALMLFLIPAHFFCFKFAFNFGVRRNLWGWVKNADDNTYSLWWDIPVVLAFALSLFHFSPFSKLVIASLGILSTLPLFMLGVRVFRIIGKHYGFSTRTLNITLSIFFFLVHPLFFVVLLGFMESSFAISRRFQYNSR